MDTKEVACRLEIQPELRLNLQISYFLGLYAPLRRRQKQADGVKNALTDRESAVFDFIRQLVH